MKQSQHLLLLLLQRALVHRYSSEPEPLPLAADANVCTGPASLCKLWPKVIAMADDQQVSGLAYDALVSLPKEQQPQKEAVLQWTVQVCSNERDYQHYIQQCTGILQELQQLAYPIVLMKGLLMAKLYPKPEHRPIGDLDLFIDPKHLPLVIEHLQKQGAAIDRQFDSKHITAIYKGVNLELHFKSIYFFSRRTERRFHLLETQATTQEELCNEIIADSYTVQVFPPLLDILYLTAHIQHHLLLEEVKLRHIVDWMLVLHHNRTALAISETNLLRQLDQLGLTRLYRAIGYISITYLGLDPDSYAGLSHFDCRDIQRGNYLLKIILDQHVPGCQPYQPRTANESFTTKARQYGELLLRCIKLSSLIPRETAAAPIGVLINAYRRRKANRRG